MNTWDDDAVLEVNPSQVKLVSLGSDRPSEQEFRRRMEGVWSFEPVDLKLDRKHQSWINNEDVVVFKVAKDYDDLAELADVMAGLRPNETNYIEVEKGFIYRLWWD
jgi:hypothetical protein